ncbi:MAG: FAD-dependent oxidoreductase, partial [Bacilli bacterium]|nr:FAD-dependent oxidoreductase [Bacilli bacterium]
IRDDNYYVVRTLKGIIKARKVIICTNYPFFIIPGLMPFKLYLERSYVICGKGENKKFNAINVDKDVYSIRYYKDNIIFAGLSESLNNRENDKMEKLLQKYKKYFGYEITKKYQNHDVMTHDYLPIVGKINNNSNLLIVTGFNKWGMTNGVISGKVISDIILEGDNEYINLFDPNRKMTGFKFLNRLVQNFKISYNYIYTKLIVPKDKKYYQDTINGVKCNVYIDKDDKKYIVNRICPHMGCTVKLNEKEKTWDCQCHGSRFTIDGELINGPSVYDIKIE